MNTLKSSCNSSKLAKISKSSQFTKAELNRITEYTVVSQVTRDLSRIKFTH